MAAATASAAEELWASRLWAAVRADRPLELWRLLSSLEESSGREKGGGGGGGGGREPSAAAQRLRELRDGAGASVLHVAVSRGCREEVLSLLLQAGADPNCRDAGGSTPLHAAFATGRYALGDVLVAAGADDGAENALGQTCYELSPGGAEEEAPP